MLDDDVRFVNRLAFGCGLQFEIRLYFVLYCAILFGNCLRPIDLLLRHIRGKFRCRSRFAPK